MTRVALSGTLIWPGLLSFGMLRRAAYVGTTGSDRQDVQDV